MYLARRICRSIVGFLLESESENERKVQEKHVCPKMLCRRLPSVAADVQSETEESRWKGSEARRCADRSPQKYVGETRQDARRRRVESRRRDCRGRCSKEVLHVDDRNQSKERGGRRVAPRRKWRFGPGLIRYRPRTWLHLQHHPAHHLQPRHNLEASAGPPWHPTAQEGYKAATG